MAERPRDAVQLLTGLAGHLRQIVGESSCYAMLHYGATEEGKRLGAGLRAENTAAILREIDALLSLDTELVEDAGDRLTIRVRAPRLVDPGERPMWGVLLGLVEGAVTASRSSCYRGSMSTQGGALLLELRRDR